MPAAEQEEERAPPAMGQPQDVDAAGFGRHRLLHDDDDTDSDADDIQPSLVLTAARAADLCPKPFRLIARAHAFARLEDLSALAALDYVDLSGNALSSLAGPAGLPRLKTVIAKENKLSTVDEHLLRRSTICVLNLAENEFVSTDWLLRTSFAPSLTVLILNSNRIVNLDGVAALSALETLVISHNDIEDLTVLGRLPRLKKLSASHNRIRALPQSIVSCESLVELRIAHNRVAQLPGENILARLAALRILDVGHNRLTTLESLATLRNNLEHLNVAGNPVSKDAITCHEMLLKVCPSLQILDGARITGGRRKIRLRREWKLKGEQSRSCTKPDRECSAECNQTSNQDLTSSFAKVAKFHSKTYTRLESENRELHFSNGTFHPSATRSSTELKCSVTTLPNHNPEYEIVDNAMDPEVFVQQARARFPARMGSTNSGFATLGSKRKRTRRDVINSSSAHEELSTKELKLGGQFGLGGPSMWT